MKASALKRGRPLALTLVSLLVVGLILGLLVWRERAALPALEPGRAWPALLVGQTAMLAGLLLAAALWAAIMRALGSRVARLRHMNIYATTYLQRYLPGTVWYVFGRGLLYREEGDSSRLVTVASGVEMMLTVISGVLVSLALLAITGTQLLQAQAGGALPAALVAFLLVAVAALALLHPASLRWITRRLKLEQTPRLAPAALAGWMALYAINWLIGGLILLANARVLLGAEGAGLPYAYVMLVSSLVGTLSVFVFFLPSNFGLQEIGISLLLSAVMPSSVAVLVAVLTRVLFVLYSALGCVVIAFITNRLLQRRLPPPATPASPP